MKRDRVNVIIQRAYGNRYDLASPVPASRPGSNIYVNRLRRSLSELEPYALAVSRRKVLIASVAAVLALALVTIHYYNQLVITQQNMLAAEGRVEALLQRRNDTAVNLSKAVLDYAEHERVLLSAVVALRGLQNGGAGGEEALRKMAPGAEKLEQLQEAVDQVTSKSTVPGTAPSRAVQASGKMEAAAAGLLPSTLMNLSALAEQYPDLKLSANFQTLMNVLDQIEKDLSSERMKHDEMVNIYATNVQIFPSNIFARIFGFEVQPYFQSSHEAKNFRPISY